MAGQADRPPDDPALGSEETRQVRRSVALGDLARGTLPLPLAPAPDAPTAPAVAPRRVVLHVQLAEAAVGGTSGIVRMEGTAGQGGRRLLTVDHVVPYCRGGPTATDNVASC